MTHIDAVPSRAVADDTATESPELALADAQRAADAHDRCSRLARRLAARLPAWGIVVALAFAAAAVPAQVLVVLSDDSAVYHEAADELKSRLPPLREGRVRIDVASAAQAPAIDAGGHSGYELVVTVGLAAARAVVADRRAASPLPPTLCLLIQRSSFDQLWRGAGARAGRLSAIYLEQPITRQLDLISLALPNMTRIGAVFGPTSAALAEEIRDGAQRHGFVLNRIDVGDPGSLYGALQKVLSQSDLLLAVPDPVALNASTARSFLLTSYRAQVPVVGFSRAFVDAGALVAVYSTPQQVGRQAAEIAARVLSGEGGLPAPQYPRYFTVGVNFFAARSLGLRIDDEAALASALAERAHEAASSRDSLLPAPGGGTGARKRP